ncbi:unnamed protein product [Phytomonas sp. Hart1]|nr:unnamed protein product [Phytomonas sp. Hart1]|eukprot:CCW71902.1 unnamed protein product [Phytomonas sp. isolate Hart1]
MKGYNTFFYFQNAHDGVVAIIIKNSAKIDVERVTFPYTEENIEVIIVHTTIKILTFLLASVYICPNTTITSFLLNKLLYKVDDDLCIFCCVFNLHHLLWNPMLRSLGNDTENIVMEKITKCGFLLRNRIGCAPLPEELTTPSST